MSFFSVASKLLSALPFDGHKFDLGMLLALSSGLFPGAVAAVANPNVVSAVGVVVAVLGKVHDVLKQASGQK